MAEATDLMGVGIAAQAAELLGNNDSIVVCAGTTQGAATVIKTTNVEFSAASSQTGAVLQSTVPIGSPVYCFTSSSTSAVVYVPSGQTLNGTLNNTFTLAQNKAAILFQYKKGFWSSIVTA